MRRTSTIIFCVDLITCVVNIDVLGYVEGANYTWDASVPYYSDSVTIHPGTIDIRRLKCGDFLGQDATHPNASYYGTSGAEVGWDDNYILWVGNANTNGDALDGLWIQNYNGSSWWDMGTPTRTVAVFLAQDHGPYLAEGLEYRIYGSNTLWGDVTGPAVLTDVYLDGWRTHDPAEDRNKNGWCGDDISAIFDLGGFYRYIKLEAWATTGTLNEPEVDAVCSVVRMIVYVDDDAPNDPKPYDLNVSDPNEDGTRDHPFDMIQEGIDTVGDGGKVIVLSGTYWETIDFRGKNIEVTGFDPDVPCDVIFPYPVIDGNGEGPVVTFNKGEDHNCKLIGFVITRGLGNPVLDSSNDLIPPTNTTLTVTVRDFLDTHPDFEMNTSGNGEKGIVRTFLGSDGKPVYAKGDGSSSPLTTGQANFDQWYRDVRGVNMSTSLQLTLSDSDGDGIYTYFNDNFFPIDNQLFGNQGRSHNYHFTLELHSQFRYRSGQTFHFTGDDDLWVFVNKRLEIDLGGLHPSQSDTLDLDTIGLVPDHIYDLDLFFAERHTTASRFQIETSIVLEPRAPVVSTITCIGASPQISNCLIVGNRCPDSDQVGANSFGGDIYFEESDAFIENCTIVDNYGGEYGAGIYSVNSNVTIGNSIIYGNTPKQIMVESGHDPVMVYSNIHGTWTGEGNMDEDPLFAYRGYWTNPADPDLLPIAPNHPNAMWIEGDYHLMSKRGRWDPNNLTWIRDEYSSLCIDAGDPNSPWECESSPNGERINMGAYGGTSQASMSWDGYILTISSTEGGAVIEPGEGDFPYDDMNGVPVKAKADEHYCFTHWSGTAVDADKVHPSDEPNAVVTVDADYSLVANFAPIEYVTLTILSSKGGSTEPSEGIYAGIERGQSINVVATPETCYRFANWTGSAVDANDVNDPDSASTSVKMNADYTLIADFVYEYLPAILPSEGGTVVIVDIIRWSGCDILITVKAIPDPCYKFTGWSGSAVTVGKVAPNAPAKTGFLADEKYTLQAHFELTMIEDDFESYNDIEPNEPGSNRIFDVWVDGFGDDTNGALVGNDLPPHAERRVVHGGRQSMPYSYDNNMKISEATKAVDCPCDWIEADVTTLSLWFLGDAKNSAEPMFVALNGDAVVYHENPAATRIAVWTEWTIDLQAFVDQGIDLTNVSTITIGFGTKGAPTAGGQGKVYFDDIRLLRSMQ